MLSVYLFNVGSGDHILLEFADGSVGIVDFYFSSHQDGPPAINFLEPRIEKLRKKKENNQAFQKLEIAFLSISHFDHDHINGLEKWMKWLRRNADFLEINQIWLPGTQDEPRLLLKNIIDKIDDYLEDDLERKDKLHLVSTSFNRGLKDLFEFVDKWEDRSLHRYAKYLSLRELINDLKGYSVFCMAPMSHHVQDFRNSSVESLIQVLLEREELLKKLAEAELDSEADVTNLGVSGLDGNLLSTVLLFQGELNNVILGGDTHLSVWEECLREINETQSVRFRNYKSLLVKASHHGSRNSSSAELWSKILEEKGKVGISSGRKYRHPHAETLNHIRSTTASAQERDTENSIYCTNKCQNCINTYLKEAVLTESTESYDLFRKQKYEEIIVANGNAEAMALETNWSNYTDPPEGKDSGLLAYKFEIRQDKADDVKVYHCLSKQTPVYGLCCFKEHETRPLHCANPSV